MNLTNQHIQSVYQSLVNYTSGGGLTDGTGSAITLPSASYALTSSYASSGGVGGTTLVTASTYQITSSWSNNSINSLTSSYSSNTIYKISQLTKNNNISAVTITSTAGVYRVSMYLEPVGGLGTSVTSTLEVDWTDDTGNPQLQQSVVSFANPGPLTPSANIFLAKVASTTSLTWKFTAGGGSGTNSNFYIVVEQLI